MNRQFPADVIHLVKTSLDTFDLFQDGFDDVSAAQARNRTLKSYSLLNSTWREFSGPLLYECVAPSSAAAVEGFIEIVRARGVTAKRCRAMRLYRSYSDVGQRRVNPVLWSLRS